ncbi:MAG: alpha/beta hydrolase, partial [Chlorobiales bacterium]|nr:alpha/beta hydrolase [Chlorobiales bacterium]
MKTFTLEIDDKVTLRWVEAGSSRDCRAWVLLLHGRTEFLEKYEEVFGGLVERGLGVISFDWRGQGLSTRLLPDDRKGHVDTFEDYLDDLDRFVRTEVAPRADRPLILLAHSTGGNVAMRYLIRNPTLFAAAIFTSPLWSLQFAPLGIRLGRLSTPIVHLVARRHCRNGDGRELAREPNGGAFEANPLTTSRER